MKRHIGRNAVTYTVTPAATIALIVDGWAAFGWTWLGVAAGFAALGLKLTWGRS